MKVLIVGGGGREHALAWKIAQSPLVDTLVAAPGNPGHRAARAVRRHRASTLTTLSSTFARHERIDLTVIGPEAPLVAGLADRFAARRADRLRAERARGGDRGLQGVLQGL